MKIRGHVTFNVPSRQAVDSVKVSTVRMMVCQVSFPYRVMAKNVRAVGRQPFSDRGIVIIELHCDNFDVLALLKTIPAISMGEMK